MKTRALAVHLAKFKNIQMCSYVNEQFHNCSRFITNRNYYFFCFTSINGRDVQRKNVVNKVDKSSLWAPWQNGPYWLSTDNKLLFIGLKLTMQIKLTGKFYQCKLKRCSKKKCWNVFQMLKKCIKNKCLTGLRPKPSMTKCCFTSINGRDVQRKNVVNNVDKSSLWTPWQKGPYRLSTDNKTIIHWIKIDHADKTDWEVLSM